MALTSSVRLHAALHDGARRKDRGILMQPTFAEKLNNATAAEEYTVGSAIENAITFLESLGYKGGDIHDDLALAAMRVRTRNRNLYNEVL